MTGRPRTVRILISLSALVGACLLGPAPALAQSGASLLHGGASLLHAETPARAPTGVLTFSDIDANAVIRGTCVRCHNERRLQGNLSLEEFDAASAVEQADITERMIRKLRAGMMPPPGTRAPGGDTLLALVENLETTVDAAAQRNPNPGRRSFQRLNRPEFEQAIRDLLALEVDAGDWLPLDQMSANFDNIADAQQLSPTLLESYLNAAAAISRMAIGDMSAGPINVTYKTSEYASQHSWDYVEGAPYGTRGGIVVEHAFPADGEYVFEVAFMSGDNTRFEDLDISIDGERVALLRHTQSQGAADGRGGAPMRTEPIFVRTGQHRVAAAFIRKSDGPYEDLIRPHDWSYAGGGSGGPGVTTLPHVKNLVVGGPFRVTGVSDSETRQKIFTCRPVAQSEERACAEQILTNLATEAFRRPLEPQEVEELLGFYDEGSAEDGFEAGVRMALEAILASPFFVLRLEREPEDARPNSNYVLDDWALASRLSYFLWGTAPDAELRRQAAEGRLSDEGTLVSQARRMLEDPRSESLGRRFAGQWLRLQDLSAVHPDPNFYPNFDENIADLMREETEVFFNSLVREDARLLELFRADYTYLNERLARHYGIPGVSGDHFRRVDYTDENRSGVLGHGSVLVLTSMANRTSPVLRGKWVMEVLLGTPPPPPPPGVPELEETEGVQEGRVLTTRERMEMHRSNPTCNACHRFMDPIGLALDNYDVTGKWRVLENGIPLDTRGDFYDGTPVSSPRELATALLGRPLPLARSFTENLMAYALGRRVEYYDQPAIREIVREAEADQFPLRSLILGVVESDAFRMKRAGATAIDAAPSNDN